MPLPSLHHLLRLLDDETPAVRESVQQVLTEFNGDLSEHLPDLGIDLSIHERSLLSRLLHPGRRKRLRKEWLVPSGGWPALGNDWDRVEALMRMLSDYLHDGITLRLPVADALDLLAEEYELSGGGPDPEAPDPSDEARSGEEDEDTPPEELLRTHGFLVYRRPQSGTYGGPLNREPQEERELVDRNAPVGATACYVVRAAGSVDPLIESLPSNEVCLAVRDITPPSAPTGLAVVPRDTGLDVVWSPSPSLDLGGYRIYRAAGGGDAEVVGEVEAAETAWHDTSVESGVLYRYEITALDRAGNEGPPSGTAEGRPE